MRWLIVLGLLACSEKRQSVLEASGSGGSGGSGDPAAPIGVIDCAAAVVQADIEAGCGNPVTKQAVGPGERGATCHRQFESAKGSLEVIVAHEAQPNLSKSSYELLRQGTAAEAEKRIIIKSFEDVPGIGERAYRYAEGVARGSPKVINVLKGPRLVTIRTQGILGERGEMCTHDQVAEVARKLVARLP